MRRKLFLPLVLVVLVARPCSAAIALDAATSAKTTGTASSLTFSHTVSGSNRILWCQITTGTGQSPTATYNSVSMTSVGNASNNGYYGELFYLLAPATGTNNVVISLSGTQLIDASCVSYTGALQSGVPEAAATTNTSTFGDIATSKSTVADNAWMVCGYSGSVNANPSIFSGIFVMRTGTNNANGGDQVGFADLGPVTPAQSTTCDINAGGTSFNIAVMASFAPDTGGGGTPGCKNGLLLLRVGCDDDSGDVLVDVSAVSAALQRETPATRERQEFPAAVDMTHGEQPREKANLDRTVIAYRLLRGREAEGDHGRRDARRIVQHARRLSLGSHRRKRANAETFVSRATVLHRVP